MEHYQIPRITTKEYNAMLGRFKGLSESNRNVAERRLFLIKSYGAIAKRQKRRMVQRFKKDKSIEKFCDRNQLNARTFKRHITLYAKYGLKGIIPHYKRRKKGSSIYESFLPKVQEIQAHGNTRIIDVYRELKNYCDTNGLQYPTYTGINRLMKLHGLIQQPVKREKEIKIKIKKEARKKGPKKPSLQELSPNYIRIVDHKSFNIAMYKYGLILPFLNPDLSKPEKRKLIDDIVNRAHRPLPRVALKITPSTIKRYISLVKKHGVDGLIPEHSIERIRKSENQVKAVITVSLDKPWESIKQLKNIIQSAQTPFKKEQQAALALLGKVIFNFKSFMLKPVSLGIDIAPDALQELTKLKSHTHRNISAKATAILMANDNHSIFEISLQVNRPTRTIYHWIEQFKKKGISFTQVTMNRKNEELSIRKNRIIGILHKKPANYNINRATWSLQSIADVYQKEYGAALSKALIARDIKKTDYTWKRAKRVLTSPDPEYKEKVNKILDTIHNLGPSDGFFFIDEAGPWPVKKYGGKSLTLKSEVKIFPQFQTPKGRVLLIGALDALNNQVTYFFIKSKDTKAVAALIKILFYKYHHYSKLYFTWDCASWHKSKELKDCIAELEKQKTGPRINIVPLPKQAQFLNVIEAVFGGVKRAVVFNSDYQSEYEMKIAISLHFEQRNEFYRKNPKRAGNKIWDRESYDLGEFEGGVYKKQM